MRFLIKDYIFCRDHIPETTAPAWLHKRKLYYVLPSDRYYCPQVYGFSWISELILLREYDIIDPNLYFYTKSALIIYMKTCQIRPVNIISWLKTLSDSRTTQTINLFRYVGPAEVCNPT